MTTTKKIGALTGKLVAGTKALPKKTAETSKSIKQEFLDGFAQTSGSNKGLGSQPPAQMADETQL